MARDTFSTVTALIRQIADDRDQSGGTIFTDTDLLPLLNADLRDLNFDLANAGASFMKGTITRNLTVGNDTIINWALPVAQVLGDDFILPLKMWEKQTGMPDSTYVVMNEKPERLPDLDQSGQLRFWSWDNGSINLLGATQNNTVRIMYERQLPVFSAPTDVVPIPGATNTLAYGVLMKAALSRGEAEVHGMAQGLYDKAYQQLKRLYIKGNQRRPRRRTPYGMRTPR